MSALLVLGVLVQPLLTAVLIPMLTSLVLCRLPIWPPKEAPEQTHEDATSPPSAPAPKGQTSKGRNSRGRTSMSRTSKGST